MKICKISFFMFFGAVVTFGLATLFSGTLQCYAVEKKAVNIDAKSDAIEWQTSFSKGLKIAKKTQKPIMIDFYAHWCSWCQKLDKTTYQDKKVIELSKNFVCIKDDTDKDKESSPKYGVKGLPTIMFLSPQGDVTNKIVGYRDGEFFITVMDEEIKKNNSKK